MLWPTTRARKRNWDARLLHGSHRLAAVVPLSATTSRGRRPPPSRHPSQHFTASATVAICSAACANVSCTVCVLPVLAACTVTVTTARFPYPPRAPLRGPDVCGHELIESAGFKQAVQAFWPVAAGRLLKPKTAPVASACAFPWPCPILC